MTGKTDPPPDLAAAVEDLLWAARLEAALSSDEPDEPRPGDDLCPEAAYPTPALAAWAVRQYSRDELLAEWQNAARQIAQWHGVQQRLLAEALDLALIDGTSRPETDLSVRSMAAELACAVGMSDRTIEQHMNDAQVLRDRFARTFEALREGRLFRAHAQVVADEGGRLGDDAVRAEYEQLALEIAPHLTTGRLRAACAAIAEKLLPTRLADRHADARERRSVQVRDIEDGMAELRVLLPAPLAHGVMDRLTQFARRVRAAEREARRSAESDAAAAGSAGGAEPAPSGARDAGDPGDDRDPGASPDQEDPDDPAREAVATDDRTMDQLRTDVLCDLLLTGHATTAEVDRDGGAGIDAIHGIVQITVPIDVLSGDDAGASACLAGHGPIDPDSARRIAGTAKVWDWVLTDRATGHVAAVERRFPSEAQRRFLRARDEHCRFPGCRQPVWRCDVDHTIDHQLGGATECRNLAHLCRRHHRLKHHSAWRVEQQPGGILVWTSPLGRIYTDRPPATLRFIPDRT